MNPGNGALVAIAAGFFTLKRHHATPQTEGRIQAKLRRIVPKKGRGGTIGP
jgi:hypothetical protein